MFSAFQVIVRFTDGPTLRVVLLAASVLAHLQLSKAVGVLDQGRGMKAGNRLAPSAKASLAEQNRNRQRRRKPHSKPTPRNPLSDPQSAAASVGKLPYLYSLTEISMLLPWLPPIVQTDIMAGEIPFWFNVWIFQAGALHHQFTATRSVAIVEAYSSNIEQDDYQFPTHKCIRSGSDHDIVYTIRSKMLQ